MQIHFSTREYNVYLRVENSIEAEGKKGEKENGWKKCVVETKPKRQWIFEIENAYTRVKEAQEQRERVLKWLCCLPAQFP